MNKLYQIFFTAALLCIQSMATAGWPNVPEPPRASLTPFAGNLNYNGLNMRSWMFKSASSVEQVLEYYRNKWTDQQIVENRYAQWQQISNKKGKYFITIQVQDGPIKGSIGRINILELDPNANTTKLARDIPMLSSSKVLNDIKSTDKLYAARTIALINSFSLSSNIQFYNDHYRANGWGLVQNNPVEGKAHLLIFKKSSDEITIMINRKQNETAVLINQTNLRGWLN